MKFLLRSLLGSLVLVSALVAPAQDGKPTTVILKGAGGQVSESGPTGQIYLNFSASASPGNSQKGAENGSMDFTACSLLPPGTTGSGGSRCVYGYGTIPASAVTSAGAKVRLTIPDLRVLPAFYLWGTESLPPDFLNTPVTFPNPYPVDITLQGDNLIFTEYSGMQRQQYQIWDGTIIRLTYNGDSVQRPAAEAGMLGDIPTILPIPNAYWRSAYQNDFKNVMHTVELQKKP